MISWQRRELSGFYSEFNERDNEFRGAYKARESAMLSKLLSAGAPSESSFVEKRKILDLDDEGEDFTQTGDVDSNDLIRDLAKKWSLTLLHPSRDEPTWFHACSVALLRAAAISKLSSGFGVFVWNHFLGTMIPIWQQGMHARSEAVVEWIDVVTLEKVYLAIAWQQHPTISTLVHWKNVVSAIEECGSTGIPTQEWVEKVERFVGRLYFTHALSVGLVEACEKVSIDEFLGAVNGSILYWPYPLAEDRVYNRNLLINWGVKMREISFSPGYFMSKEWREELLFAAESYLVSFDNCFCTTKNRVVAQSGNLFLLGENLNTFGRLVECFNVDEFRIKGNQ